ncbi:MAG: putative sulfate/molybdate transporter [Deltaproteobacteria bacterium]|nr:putative sulfate/molybdate transporter [Deltaproteobacteria bacterium]
MNVDSNETQAPPAVDCDGWCFNRQEVAGSLGDLGVLLPIALGLILINGLDATAVFVGVGLYYVLGGLYFRITIPVQPMKVIGAYAIANLLSPLQITSAGMIVGVLLLVLALTGTISLAGRLVPKSTVRGVQLTTGVLLFVQGVRFILGESSLQVARGTAEPFLSMAAIGHVPIGIILGVSTIVLILLLLNNKKFPAALIVVAGGLLAGLVLGGWRGLAGFRIGFSLPEFLPYGWPETADLIVALTVLALPQVPMTVGNAVIAQADLTREYFGEQAARRSTFRALAISMGLANVICAFFGAMPMCHGAGGLAAHYRFGARTVGSNLIIGGTFLLVGLLLGKQAILLFSLLPFSVLGALLVFSGAQLALMILDVKDRKDMFVVVSMLGVALVSNLAIGFGVGVVLAYLFKFKRLSV